MLTVFGLIVTTIPFLLIFCFPNKTLGFLSVFSFFVGFHLLLGFTTQLLHIFNYQTIISFSSILAILSLYIFVKKERHFSKIKINWWVIIIFLIIIFQLWSVHYLYIGTISTINGYTMVTKNTSPFPYFSDEWVGASLSKYSIENNSLPIVNPLNNNIRTTSPMAFFFSFLAEIFLLFNLNPIFNFAILPLATGFLICLFSYIFLRIHQINNSVSVLTILGITYITNGANLPGIWYLLPYIMGLIMLLISLSLLELKNIKSSIFSSILSLIFYPPIIIFIAPIWLAYLIKNFKNPKIYKAILIIIPILLIIIWYILGLATNNFNLGSVFQTFLNYIIRPELDNGIPNFMIWNIIPLILLPFILLGLIKIIKNKIYYFFAPITIGLIFWFIYLSTWKVIIIEYARVVAVTSILLVIVSGFGIDWILKLFQRKYPGFFKKNVIYILKSIVILLIIFMSFSYTSHKNWLKLTIKLNPPESHRTGSPAAPVNKYLTSDDLKLFNNIHQERFVSLPWKGLVIGAATNNFPLDSKPSTITNKILSYDVFMSTDCRGKDSLSIKYNIDFAYTKPFNCSNFKPVGYSNEGMFLYEFKQNN